MRVSGLVAIAAAKAGAASVVAADIDALAAAAIRLNAGVNAVAIDVRQDDLPNGECAWDIVLVGDMCYERRWPSGCWHGSPRPHNAALPYSSAIPAAAIFRKPEFERLTAYQVPTLRDLEDRDVRETAVYRLTPDARADPI